MRVTTCRTFAHSVALGCLHVLSVLRAEAGVAETRAHAQRWSGLGQCIPLPCTATAVQE